MLPVKSNITDRSCPEPISSNCIIVPIELPCADTCSKNLTDVLYSLCSNIQNTTTSCYTGSWVGFSASIPTSGSSGGNSWTITDFGRNFRGVPGVGTGSENVPGYRWTREGDLKIRGSFSLTIDSIPGSGFLAIPLVSIPTTCFPANWIASQSAIIAVDIYPNEGNLSGAAQRGFLTIDYPTGILYLNVSFANAAGIFIHSVFMGGTTFNLA